MLVRMIVCTPEAEKTMAYIARASSPHQDNPDYAKLLKYCIEHGHWSVLEHATMTVEIETSRMISAQILRHRSFKFQEFSQRYAEPATVHVYDPRKQDVKNRQNSLDEFDDDFKADWKKSVKNFTDAAFHIYEAAIAAGIAKECARAILPMCVGTKMYMTGDVRCWIHYIQLRTHKDTQLEHREIAEAVKEIFIGQFPVVSEALDWA
jgi:thymidylate synthase (FAD)